MNNLDELVLCDWLQIFVHWPVKLSCITTLIDWVVLSIVLMDVEFGIEFLQHDRKLLIIELGNVQTLFLIDIKTWEGLEKPKLIMLRQVNLKLLNENFLKIFETNQVLIFLICMFSYILQEFLPLLIPQFRVDFLKYLGSFILLNFEMKLAKVINPLNWLPALSMLTVYLFLNCRLSLLF